MSERWRCFVAVPIGEDLRAALAAAAAAWRVRPDLDGLRWSDPDAWHVTIAFLGSVDAAEASRLGALIGDVAEQTEPMQLRTGDLGAFPSPGRARVLWYGVDDPSGELAALARELQLALGIEAGGPFRPHLTLARSRRAPVDLSTWLAQDAVPEGELLVDRLQLMRSHLGSGPARYEIVASSSLAMIAHV